MSSDQNSEDFYGRGNNAAAGRGIALVVIAIAVGLAVLKWGLDDTSTAGTAPAKTTVPAVAKTVATQPTSSVASLPDAGSTTPTSSVIPPGQLRDPSAISVQVANGSGANGVGAKYSTTLIGSNYVAKAAKTAKATDKSVVYYEAGFQQEALVLAAIVKVPAASVLPIPPEGVEGKDGPLLADKPNILVIIGTDLAPPSNG